MNASVGGCDSCVVQWSCESQNFFFWQFDVDSEEEDAVVARLANLLDGTDLRRQIRDELRRGLEE